MDGWSWNKITKDSSWPSWESLSFYAAQIRPTRFAYFSACTIWSKKARPGQQVKRGNTPIFMQFQGHGRGWSVVMFLWDPGRVFLAWIQVHPASETWALEVAIRLFVGALHLGFTQGSSTDGGFRKPSWHIPTNPQMRFLTPLCRSWRFRVFSGLP